MTTNSTTHVISFSSVIFASLCLIAPQVHAMQAPGAPEQMLKDIKPNKKLAIAHIMQQPIVGHIALAGAFSHFATHPESYHEVPTIRPGYGRSMEYETVKSAPTPVSPECCMLSCIPCVCVALSCCNRCHAVEQIERANEQTPEWLPTVERLTFKAILDQLSGTNNTRIELARKGAQRTDLENRIFAVQEKNRKEKNRQARQENALQLMKELYPESFAQAEQDVVSQDPALSWGEWYFNNQGLCLPSFVGCCEPTNIRQAGLLLAALEKAKKSQKTK